MIEKKDRHFWKMTAGGNDFIIFDRRSNPSLHFSPSDIKQLCSRKVSIGADGFILMDESERADITMRYFNADGSSAPLCGNGVRCLARLAFMRNIAVDKIKIETGAGIITAEDSEENIRLQMLPPSKLELNTEIELENEIIVGHAIDVGALFFVIPYKDIGKCPVEQLGCNIRHHSYFNFSAGTNVSFFNVEEKNKIRLRVYERGVEEETLSCGTGSLATTLVCAALGLVEAPVLCFTQGGTIIKVDFTYKDNEFSRLSIEGDARLIYEGKIFLHTSNKKNIT
jgi:diaminopimelate epimerase